MATKFTNSPLATYVRISPFKNANRYDETTGVYHTIKKITWHHMAGVATCEQFGDIVTRPDRNMSATYCVDKDARVGRFLDESDRPWTSSSRSNDFQAVTIEISNSKVGGDWPISDKVMEKAIELTVDICKRNGIKELIYTGDATGNFTFHKMFAATACLPVDRTEVLTPTGWVPLKDIEIGDPIATVHVDNLKMKFSPVLNKVPEKIQDTYITRDFEGTSDHRVMFYNQSGRQFVGQYKDLFDKSASIYIPNAGYFEGSGMPISKSDMEFLVAVQADGHYMRDGDCYYGVEFHLSKQRKIKRVKKLLSCLGVEYKVCEQSDGTTKIRIYGKKIVNICEEYLNNKRFTWDWLNMTHQQAIDFLNMIMFYDGCEANRSYSSAITENVDIVQAIAALNGVGSKIADTGTRVYLKKAMRSLGDNKRKRKPRQTVSCVTVESGFILIRQHGRTTITGNCPGPYIESRANEIVAKINAKLKESEEVTTKPTTTTQTATTTTSTFKITKGSLVSIASNAVYYTGGSIPSWVKQQKWYVASISNDRAVLGLNEKKDRNIQSPINTKYLTLVAGVFKEYTVSIVSTEKLYKDPTNTSKNVSTVGKSGVYTIVGEVTINGVKYGKLKSGAGYVNLNSVNGSNKKVDTTIRVGDKVKVLKNIQYNGKTFKVYCSSYMVLEVKGDRVVISSDGKNVTCAINSKNLQKI